MVRRSGGDDDGPGSVIEGRPNDVNGGVTRGIPSIVRDNVVGETSFGREVTESRTSLLVTGTPGDTRFRVVTEGGREGVRVKKGPYEEGHPKI